MPDNLTPLSALASECYALARMLSPRLAQLEQRLDEAAPAPEPTPEPAPAAPVYWQAERDHYEATIRQMGAGARAWQSAYAALHKQLRDNGLEPVRWMESINV